MLHVIIIQNTQLSLSFLMAIIFAGIHLYCFRLRFLDTLQRSSLLSFSGGISIAYVFLHIFPSLNEHQKYLTALSSFYAFIPEETAIFVISMSGFVLFYGLERFAHSRSPEEKIQDQSQSPSKVFWLHIISFGYFNILIGYLLLHLETRSVEALILYTVALVPHFMIIDKAFRVHFNKSYLDYGRWILATAVIIGWLLGVLMPLAPWISSLFFAFLSGGILLNVMKEELPEERESRFLPFLLGCMTYTLILLVLQNTLQLNERIPYFEIFDLLNYIY